MIYSNARNLDSHFEEFLCRIRPVPVGYPKDAIEVQAAVGLFLAARLSELTQSVQYLVEALYKDSWAR